MEQRLAALESRVAAIIAWITAQHPAIDGSPEGVELLKAVISDGPTPIPAITDQQQPQ